MNQNVSNSSTWLKKLSSENFTGDRSSPKSTGVESSFSNLLSNQLSKANVKLSSSNTSKLPNEMDSIKSNAKSFLKKVEPTANRLAVKSPDKIDSAEVKQVSSQQNDLSKKDDSKDGMTVVANDKPNSASKGIQTEKNDTIGQKNEDLSVEEDVVKIEDVMNMLQQVLSSLINQLTENPELGKKEQLQEQIQALSSLLGEISSLKDFKVDLKTVDQVKTALEGMLSSTETSTTLNAEALNMLKATIKDIKEKYTKSDSKGFNNLLEQKMDSVANAKTETTSTSEIKTSESNTNSQKSATGTTNSENSSTDGKSNGETQDKSLSIGKEKIAVQTNGNESKAVVANNSAEFSAKLESASIAFGKVEVANQVNRTPIQQSIMDQLINSPRMQIKQTEQGTMMTMKLNPEVLGDIEIKMEIVKGVLQAEIKVENMIVKGAIEASLSDLKNALSDKGYQVDSLNVFVGKDGQGNHSQQQHQQNERQGHVFMEDMELESGQYGFDAVINDNQIDYRG